MVGAALVALALLAGSAAAGEQKGTLAPGAKVEVDTDADSFSSFNFEHDGKKTVVMQIIGPTTKEIPVDANQKVGHSARYGGKKVTIVNTGDVAVRYEVN
jgi:hypothetical protein